MYSCANPLKLCGDPKRFTSPPFRFEASVWVCIIELSLQGGIPEGIADNTVAFGVQACSKSVVILETALDSLTPS